jgi:outer membrane biosynthesis protein TonB
MTQGSSYPLAGIKIGQAPAHRLSTPTPKLAVGVSPSTSDAPEEKAEAAEPTDEATATRPKAQAKTDEQNASKTVTKHDPSTTPKQPSKESNEVEVTTSDQISEHGLPTNGRSTHSSSAGAGSTSTGVGRSGAPDRRTAMGVASVRIAGRLTQNELGSRTGDIRTPDTSVGPDELLQLLGEYLVSGGLQNPEIHVRSNGQTIVLDLLNPAKGYR